MKFADQVAIVTGAGRNIGEDISKLLARHGATIAVVDLETNSSTSLDVTVDKTIERRQLREDLRDRRWHRHR